jgi:hypothetical protein
MSSLLYRMFTCEWSLDQQKQWVIDNANADSLPWASSTLESKEWKQLTAQCWNALANARDADYLHYLVLSFMTDTDHPLFFQMTQGDSEEKMAVFYLYLIKRMTAYWSGLLPGGQPITIVTPPDAPRVRQLVNDSIAVRSVVYDIMSFYLVL